MSVEVQEWDQQHIAIMPGSGKDDGKLLVTTDVTRLIIGGDLSHLITRITEAVNLIDGVAEEDDLRECEHCGDMVQILNSRDECSACEAEREKPGAVCVECREWIEEDPGPFSSRGVGWTFRNKTVLCAGCLHDAERSGWIPGESE